MLQSCLPSLPSKNLILVQSFFAALVPERISKETDSFFWFRGTIPFRVSSVFYPRFLKIRDMIDG
jgi:hypothetical protein